MGNSIICPECLGEDNYCGICFGKGEIEFKKKFEDTSYKSSLMITPEFLDSIEPEQHWEMKAILRMY